MRASLQAGVGASGPGGVAPGGPPPAGCAPGFVALQPASAGEVAALSIVRPTASFCETPPGHTALYRECHGGYMQQINSV